jgi:hypothetical protein
MSRIQLLKEMLILGEDERIINDKFAMKMQTMVSSITKKKGVKYIIFKANLDSSDNLIDIDVISVNHKNIQERVNTIQDVFNGSSIEGSLNKVEASFKLADQFKPIFKKTKISGTTRQTKLFFCYGDTTRGLNLKTNKWERIH